MRSMSSGCGIVKGWCAAIGWPLVVDTLEERGNSVTQTYLWGPSPDGR